MIKAFLDSGAKAVICPSAEPPETQLTNFFGSGEFNFVENGKFEIGEEEAEDEEIVPASPESDWDSDLEKNGDHSMDIWDADEKEISQFVCKLYDALFREGSTINVALQHALASHRKLRYACHHSNIQ